MKIVNKTQKEHKCEDCGEIIAKGSKAETWSRFTGCSGYKHFPECPKWQARYDNVTGEVPMFTEKEVEE